MYRNTFVAMYVTSNLIFIAFSFANTFANCAKLCTNQQHPHHDGTISDSAGLVTGFSSLPERILCNNQALYTA